jgi:hypothetical protein
MVLAYFTLVLPLAHGSLAATPAPPSEGTLTV